ncbi:hypothetical protein TrVFT333_000534 [Trichoderma virens FT-333]|nr:hypothetical protein TrVFT333_000534 [Trichoderma virens FT-333]
MYKSKTGPTSKSMGFNPDQRARSAHSIGRDVRRTRVSKACERCRLKKIKVRLSINAESDYLGLTKRSYKCDGELPCQKCKNNGHVCTPGLRKRTIHVEYKQVPKSYVEFLETTHLALIGSVHKLYTMIQKNQPWDLGDPELNDQGELVIHDVAKKLGCIGPNGEIELPIQCELPTTATGMARLAAHPERQQYQDEDDEEHDEFKEADSPMNDHASDDSPSSEPMQSIKTELESRKEAFTSYNNSITHSPQSLCSVEDSEHSHSGSDGVNSCVTSSPNIPSMTDYTDSSLSQPGSEPDEIAAFLHQYGQTPNMGTLDWDFDESDYAPKGDLSIIPEFGMEMNIEGQMMLPEYNDHSAWLSQTLSGWREENQISIES